MTKNNIKAYRRRACLTQAALGEMIGRSETMIHFYEHSISAINPEIQERLAVALQCTVQELLCQEKEVIL